ncbi:LacI family DNA-binding transcriptional regulator [Celeribacter sp.]|uniref:LacI family DNA-binding transcriptional regulator n=1 Tax=Celeribacter sp. TaxID=1890673 RepID=UPI003A9138F2
MTKTRASGNSVTLKTIADELGVSVTTVARSLKDGHKISPKTVERVQEAANRLGYVRNLDGLKLRTGQTFVLLALLGVSTEEEIGDSGSVGLLNGIHDRLVETPYSVRTIPVSIGELGMERLMDAVRGRNVDGLILDHTEPQDERVRFLLEQGTPFVTFGRTELFTPHAYFDIDNEYAAWQGTSAMINQGHRRIAMIDADPRFIFVQQRLRGYRKALDEHGIPYDPALVRHVEINADHARDAAEILTRVGVDAFVCVNELVFLGARAGARKILGENVSAMGFSVRTGTNIGDYLGTPISASYFSRRKAGTILADTLIRLMGGADVRDCQRIEKTTLLQ